MRSPSSNTSPTLKQFAMLLLFAFFLNCKATYAQDSAAPRMILRSVLVNTVEKRYDTLLVCSYDQNNFQFVYEGIDLSFSGQIEYRYRLNENDQWQFTQERTLVFPSLPAGEYIFEVDAKSNKSNWSAPVKYSFEIVPPLYMRWWFIVLCSLLLIALIASLIIRRNRNYLKKTQQEFIAQQRMNEMENQAKQAMMNPHFVFNALNSIQQYINDNDRVLANKYLTKFSRLIRLNLDLVNKNLITLEEELEKLKLYLEIEQLRFGEKLNYEFIIDKNLETDMIYIPSMILQPFIENAIWHGLMPSSKGGTITLHASEFNEEKMLRIEIKDDGIGIKQSRRLNQQKTRKSFGIELTIDRLKLFASKNNSTSGVLFFDLSEKNKLQHGTLVVIELPMVFEKK